VLVQQSDVGEVAIGVNEDGSVSAFNFSVLSDGTLSAGATTVTGNMTINPTSASSLNVHQTNNERVEITLQTDATTNSKQRARVNFVTLDRSWWWGMSTDGTVRLFDTTAGTDTIIVRGGAGNYGMTIGSSGTGYGVETASARLHAVSTTEQLRLGYDVTNRASFTVNSSGDLTIAPTGGNTSITGTLDVSGDVTSTGQVYAQATANSGFVVNTTDAGFGGLKWAATSDSLAARFVYQYSTGKMILGTAATNGLGYIEFHTANDGLALTLDSSQNATFAGDVTLSSGDLFVSSGDLRIGTTSAVGSESLTVNGDQNLSGDLIVGGTEVTLSNLPTADPVNAGQLWNDSGTVKVSAG